MPWKTYFINALIAGTLAAGTNHLAIVAILYYILPRKKGEIARRIRDIVATDLITPEKMRAKLDAPEVGDVFRRHIRDILADTLARELPSPDELLAGHRDELPALLDRLRDSLLSEIQRQCSSPEFVDEALRPFLEERWRTAAGRTPEQLFPDQTEAMVDFAEQWIRDLEHSEPFRRNARRMVDDWLAERIAASRSLGDLLPSSLVRAAEDLATAQAPAIMGQLIETLRQPEIHEAIAASVMNAITAQLRNQGVMGGIKGAVAGFIRLEEDVYGVCRRLPDTLRDKYTSAENRNRFATLLRDAVGKMLTRDLDPAIRTPEWRAGIVDAAMVRLWRGETFALLGGEARKMLEPFMRRMLAESAIKTELSGFGNVILDGLADAFQRVVRSREVGQLLAGRFNEFAAVWMNRPLGRLDRFISDATVDKLAEAAAIEGRLMLRERLGELADEAGIWDIVTESIEGYDNRQLAGLVRQLARSELRWVTILGGVIGVAVGLLQTFLQS